MSISIATITSNNFLHNKCNVRLLKKAIENCDESMNINAVKH